MIRAIVDRGLDLLVDAARQVGLARPARWGRHRAGSGLSTMQAAIRREEDCRRELAGPLAAFMAEFGDLLTASPEVSSARPCPVVERHLFLVRQSVPVSPAGGPVVGDDEDWDLINVWAGAS